MKTWSNTIDCILDVPVPQNTDSYTSIPHSVFLNEIKEELGKKGYDIADERYLTSDGCQVITGVYKVSSGIDTEMTPAITFVNSYNKKRTASIRASAMVLICTNGMCGMVENGSYVRKHTGNALEDFRQHIQLVINGLAKEFDRLVTNKNEMKSITLDKGRKAQIIGEMILEKMINPTQLSILLKEVRKPSYACFSDDSLWSFYNHCTEAFKDTHPLNYDRQHVALHTYMCDKFYLTGSKGLFEKLAEPNISQISGIEMEHVEIIEIEPEGRDFDETEEDWQPTKSLLA